MEAMERMMARFLRAEVSQIATKDDLKEVRDESRQNAVRIDKVMEDLAELKRQMDEVKQQGVGAATSSATSISAGTSWRPRLIHVRGFAPYGSGVRTHKRDAKALQEQVMATLSSEDRSGLSALERFVQNHQASWNVHAATTDDIAMIAGRMTEQMRKHKITFMGHELKAMMEVSRERRKAAKCYLTPRDALSTIATDDMWEGCGRALNIYALPTYSEMGAYNKQSGEWRWDEAALIAAGCKVDAVKDAMEKPS